MAVTVKNGNTGGTDFAVASDSVTPTGSSAGNVQYMKLVDGVAGGTGVVGASLIPSGGTVSSLHVTPRQDIQRIAVASSGLTTATTAYAAGDQAGAQFTIASAARASGGTGSILGVALVDNSARIGSCDIVFSRASLTLAGDNAVWAVSDADALNIVEIVSLNYAIGLTNNSFARLMGLGIPYDCSGGTSLYASVILRSVPTSNFFTAATDLNLIVWVARD